MDCSTFGWIDARLGGSVQLGRLVQLGGCPEVLIGESVHGWWIRLTVSRLMGARLTELEPSKMGDPPCNGQPFMTVPLDNLHIYSLFLTSWILRGVVDITRVKRSRN